MSFVCMYVWFLCFVIVFMRIANDMQLVKICHNVIGVSGTDFCSKDFYISDVILSATCTLCML